MEHTLETLDKLKLGSILVEDVLANTITPIIRKETKITREHIQVLRAFNINQVLIKVENVFNRTEEELSKLNEEKTNVKVNKDTTSLKKTDFKGLYIDSVNKYHKEFTSWESGMKVDVAKLRSIIMPLVERALQEPQIFLRLNEYSDLKKYNAHHSIATGIISGAVAKKMDYSPGEIIQIATAGILADCGMAKVDVKIREKKSFLTETDFAEIKKHPINSFQMIKDSPLLKPEMKLAIFQHHERLDGSGYPKGDKMDSISIFAQIIAVSDVYHAMTSERIFRAKSSPFKVMEMIREEEFGKYNFKVVNALLSLVGELPISTRVRLSDGSEGEVVFLHRDSPIRPMIRLCETGQLIDLAAKRALYIESIID